MLVPTSDVVLEPLHGHTGATSQAPHIAANIDPNMKDRQGHYGMSTHSTSATAERISSTDMTKEHQNPT